MKKGLIFLLISLLLVSTFAGCTDAPSESSIEESSQTESESTETRDERADTLWKDEYADVNSGFSVSEDIWKVATFVNGEESKELVEVDESNDTRILFSTQENTRVVVPAEGYMLTLPGTDVEADYSLGQLRSKYTTDQYCLTVTYEDQNPYGATESGWNTYMTEWLTRMIDDTDYLTENKIIRTRAVSEVEVGVYTVKTYCMKINLSNKIQYPYYQIAIIRPTDSYKYFYLFVMKSSDKMLDEFDAIVSSFAEIDRVGTPTGSIVSYDCVANPNWNEETKAYYELLTNQTDVDFGAFPDKHAGTYADWLFSDEQLGTPDVYMSYLHLGWGSTTTSPANTINYGNKYAKGNGFDGNPIFLLTYQMTSSNNSCSGYTPMFDIIRGKYDSYFRELAQAVKSYKHPILFRVNNEMDSDWCDYSGIMTLLDPDIFQEAWRRMYDIFEEEGVDNCIWIFNGLLTACPYSNWGETLNYYPGDGYAQVFAVSTYEMNNVGSASSFTDLYKQNYEKFGTYFDKFPWVIGEFACGAGGEAYYDWGSGRYISTTLGGRVSNQVSFVKDMINCFEHNQEPGYEFCSHIKVAVWFSANDLSDVDGDGEEEVLNYLKLDETSRETIDLLREYIQNKNQKNQ